MCHYLFIYLFIYFGSPTAFSSSARCLQTCRVSLETCSLSSSKTLRASKTLQLFILLSAVTESARHRLPLRYHRPSCCAHSIWTCWRCWPRWITMKRGDGSIFGLPALTRSVYSLLDLMIIHPLSYLASQYSHARPAPTNLFASDVDRFYSPPRICFRCVTGWHLIPALLGVFKTVRPLFSSPCALIPCSYDSDADAEDTNPHQPTFPPCPCTRHFTTRSRTRCLRG